MNKTCALQSCIFGGDRRGIGSVPTPRPEVLRGAATTRQAKPPNCGSQGPPKRERPGGRDRALFRITTGPTATRSTLQESTAAQTGPATEPTLAVERRAGDRALTRIHYRKPRRGGDHNPDRAEGHAGPRERAREQRAGGRTLDKKIK